MIKRLGEILVSENNRLTYIYKESEIKKIIEIINVSFEVKYKHNWITILRYDTHHGYMHRHSLISLDEKTEIIDKIGIRQKGSSKRLLRWAIDDIKSNYISYKRKIIERTVKKLDIQINIDFY